MTGKRRHFWQTRYEFSLDQRCCLLAHSWSPPYRSQSGQVNVVNLLNGAIMKALLPTADSSVTLQLLHKSAQEF